MNVGSGIEAGVEGRCDRNEEGGSMRETVAGQALKRRRKGAMKIRASQSPEIMAGDQKRRRLTSSSGGGESTRRVEYPTCWFWDGECEKKFNKLWERPVIIERLWRSDTMGCVWSLFEKLGWANIMKPLDYYYPRLVKLFYSNMRREEAGGDRYSYRSYVLGKYLSLEVDCVARALGIDNGGQVWEFTNDKLGVGATMSCNMIADALTEKAYPRQGSLKLADLTPVAKEVLMVVQSNILPRSSRTNSCPPGYAFVVYCILTGYHLNLPYLMLSYMVYCSDSKRPYCMPYPSAISRLLEHFEAVGDDPEKEHLVRPLPTASIPVDPPTEVIRTGRYGDGMIRYNCQTGEANGVAELGGHIQDVKANLYEMNAQLGRTEARDEEIIGMLQQIHLKLHDVLV